MRLASQSGPEHACIHPTHTPLPFLSRFLYSNLLWHLRQVSYCSGLASAAAASEIFRRFGSEQSRQVRICLSIPSLTLSVSFFALTLALTPLTPLPLLWVTLPCLCVGIIPMLAAGQPWNNTNTSCISNSCVNSYFTSQIVHYGQNPRFEMISIAF